MKTIDTLESILADAPDVEKEIFKVDVLEYVKRRNRLRVNLESELTLIMGQCTKLTRMQLEVLLTWESVDDISNVIKLLNMAKSLLHQMTSQMYHPLSLYLEKISVYGLQQGPHMTNAQLLEKLKARVEVVKDIGGYIITDSK